MVPDRDKPKRISMRPMLAVVVCVTCVAVSIERGGGWRVAGFIMAGILVAGVVIFRILIRRIGRAREPDPQSTLKI